MGYSATAALASDPLLHSPAEGQQMVDTHQDQSNLCSHLKPRSVHRQVAQGRNPASSMTLSNLLFQRPNDHRRLVAIKLRLKEIV